MFDSELYSISEEAFNSIDHKELQKRNQKIEKKVLEIIKKYAYSIDKDGFATIMVSSKERPHEYDALHSIINSGRQKYFEEEYSLYFLSDRRVELYSDVCSIITFNWNSHEYYIRNMPKAKNR